MRTAKPEAPAKRVRLYFPSLNGLRFFAALSVVLFHCFHTESGEIKEHLAYKTAIFFTVPGELGVNFFFVLISMFFMPRFSMVMSCVIIPTTPAT